MFRMTIRSGGTAECYVRQARQVQLIDEATYGKEEAEESEGPSLTEVGASLETTDDG